MVVFIKNHLYLPLSLLSNIKTTKCESFNELHFLTKNKVKNLLYTYLFVLILKITDKYQVRLNLFGNICNLYFQQQISVTIYIFVTIGGGTHIG